MIAKMIALIIAMIVVIDVICQTFLGGGRTRGAEAALEAKLQKYDSSPWDLNRYHLASQAECNGNRWSHIDTPYREANLETGSSI